MIEQFWIHAFYKNIYLNKWHLKRCKLTLFHFLICCQMGTKSLNSGVNASLNLCVPADILHATIIKDKWKCKRKK